VSSQLQIPKKPGIPGSIIFSITFAFVLTVVTMITVEFSLIEIIENFSRPNMVVDGLLSPDLTQIFSERSRNAFLETLQLAVLGTISGGGMSLLMAYWATDFGNPIGWLRAIVRTFNNVIRSILLALFFFSMAVVTKLTGDTMDGIDQGPIEAAKASGSGQLAMLRMAVVPQILPAYSSFLLYGFELNLRASAVLGLVGAGGIGSRIEFFRSRLEWSEVWGLVLMFFLVVFIVERISVTIRRRLI
jgi:phosphonate transport system permease protein